MRASSQSADCEIEFHNQLVIDGIQKGCHAVLQVRNIVHSWPHRISGKCSSHIVGVQDRKLGVPREPVRTHEIWWNLWRSQVICVPWRVLCSPGADLAVIERPCFFDLPRHSLLFSQCR